MSSEAQDDIDAIVESALSYELTQEYATNDEYIAAYALTETFRSITIETSRVKYEQARSGLLNTQSLASALTTRRCFHRKEETLSLPYVALLLDQSGSMMGAPIQALTSAGRVINGALMQAKIKTKVIGFGGHDELQELKVLPSAQSLSAYGGTPTGKAMKAANDWLESESAERGLVIIVTDGSPNSEAQAQEQRERCEQLGGYTAAILINNIALEYINPRLRKCVEEGARNRASVQFNDFEVIHSIADLPNVAESLIAGFIAG